MPADRSYARRLAQYGRAAEAEENLARRVRALSLDPSLANRVEDLPDELRQMIANLVTEPMTAVRRVAALLVVVRWMERQPPPRSAGPFLIDVMPRRWPTWILFNVRQGVPYNRHVASRHPRAVSTRLAWLALLHEPLDNRAYTMRDGEWQETWTMRLLDWTTLAMNDLSLSAQR